VPIQTVPLASVAERAGGIFTRPAGTGLPAVPGLSDAAGLGVAAGETASRAPLDATRLLNTPSRPAAGGVTVPSAGNDTPGTGEPGTEAKPLYPDRGWSFAVTSWVMNMLGALIALVAGGFGVSVYFAAGVIIYLLMRQLCDGQDQNELWVPGMVEGTMAPGAAALHGAEPPPEPPR
jgi:hypothetical protein